MKILPLLLCFVLISTQAAKTNGKKRLVSITYTIWEGDENPKVHSIIMNVQKGSSFYSVMRQAMKINKHFHFSAMKHPKFGHYIKEIDNHREIIREKVHWMIYKLPSLPDPANPPSEKFLTHTGTGVDHIKVDQGDNYLFWLKHVSY